MARQAALGKRVEAINEGFLGPVLKRWINGSVTPISELLRNIAGLYLQGDVAQCAKLLDSPLFGLAEWGQPGSLKPIMAWLLRGESPGRSERTTYADDLALTGLATAVTKIAATRHTGDGSKAQGFTVNAVVDQMADALRETVTGQFISTIQGADAMMRVRSMNDEAWKQNRSLTRIVGMMRSQVKPFLDRKAQAEPDTFELKGKKVLTVSNTKGDLRRIELRRAPDTIDWQMLLLAWGGDDVAVRNRNRPLWLAFAMLILSAAQRTGGWFDITTRGDHTPTLSAIADRGSKRHRSKTKILVLSEQAQEAVSKDIEKWVAAGFYNEPMIVKPEKSDYLTVKHRPFSGRKGPRGLNSVSSPMMDAAGRTMAESQWQVNRHMLAWMRDNPKAEALAKKDMGDLPSQLCLGAYRRDAQEEALYLPTSMDFRGRLYYRPTWINPQQGSLNKALLQFAEGPRPDTYGNDPRHDMDAVAMYCSELMGFGKRLAGERRKVFHEWYNAGYPFMETADDPLVLQACGLLLKAERMDQIPVQLDGTCNGLQHLSALMRDPVGAKSVNLTAQDRETSVAQDIYQEVATKLTGRFERIVGGFPGQGDHAPGWARRLALSGVQFDRKLTKRPVMVLPFGGTITAVQEALKAGLLERLDASTWSIWTQCKMPDAVEGNYSAFADRDLVNHPLFNKDIQHLGQLLWGCITETIPKAMATMRVFAAIGGKIGDHGLAWQTPMGLWVMQAKAFSERRQVALRGFHLPTAVRRLTLLTDSDKVDGRYHRQGIVANFIHSMDAAHLGRVLFRWGTQDPIGAIHDCVLTRPSCVGELNTILRSSFFDMYTNDPLRGQVKTIDPETKAETLYQSWYELAYELDLEFPPKGTWEPSEVLGSPWFFA